MLINPVSAVTIRLVSPTARMLAGHLVLEVALALLESFGLQAQSRTGAPQVVMLEYERDDLASGKC